MGYTIRTYLQVDLPDPDFPAETEPSLCFECEVVFDSIEVAEKYRESLARQYPSLVFEVGS